MDGIIFITERDIPHKMQIKEIPLERVRSADLGLEKFATFDDSTSIAYPAFLRMSEKKIRQFQRWFSHKHNGSRRSLKLGKRLARLHLHVNRQREDKTSRTSSLTKSSKRRERCSNSGEIKHLCNAAQPFHC